jgi:hypothetical protein
LCFRPQFRGDAFGRGGDDPLVRVQRGDGIRASRDGAQQVHLLCERHARDREVQRTDDREATRILAEPAVFQVRQHPRKDRAWRRRRKVRVREAAGVAVDRAEEPCAVDTIEHRSAVERVAPAVGDAVFLREEVAGHPNPDGTDAAPSCHFDQEHRQGDGDAATTLDDRVEKRIAWVAVVVCVALESVHVEHEPANPVERRGARRIGELVQVPAPRVDVDLRPNRRGDAERGFVESKVGLVTVHDRGEAVGRVHR